MAAAAAAAAVSRCPATMRPRHAAAAAPQPPPRAAAARPGLWAGPSARAPRPVGCRRAGGARASQRTCGPARTEPGRPGVVAPGRLGGGGGGGCAVQRCRARVALQERGGSEGARGGCLEGLEGGTGRGGGGRSAPGECLEALHIETRVLLSTQRRIGVAGAFVLTRVGTAVGADSFRSQLFPCKGASRSGAVAQSPTWGAAANNATFPQRHILVDPGPARFGSP
jgi:hypothetical protein